jgi:glycosyltransferase involved in cell wall biosynthesis
VWSDLDTSRNFGLIRYAHDVPLIRREMERVDRDRARRELDLKDDDLCVLALGTVCERKGQRDLLRAFAALPGPAAARLKCLVVGARDAEPYSRRLEAMVEKLPPDRRERFVIVPETGETSAFWQAADVFCCTSRLESYPLVIMEAMAAALPIVTTPVYGIAEQVEPSVNAMIYQPGDIAALARHLTSMAEDEALRRSMAERSPDVLRSLPDDTRMNELYRRTIIAASQSAPLFPASPDESVSISERGARGRVWYADPARRRAAANGGHLPPIPSRAKR